MTSLSFVLHDLAARATSSSRGVPNEGAEGLPRLVTWRGAVACVPTAWAAYVAATRIVDYKHRPADVLAGAAGRRVRRGVPTAWVSPVVERF